MPKLGYSSRGRKGLSYSRLQTLHTCPRKFEIENVIGYRPQEENMTFAYGHFVGAAIQEYLSSKDLDKAIFAGMLEYDLDDPWTEGTFKEQRAKKSFFHAIDIVQKFEQAFKDDPLLEEGLRGWEIAKFEYKGEMIPALELTFEIIIPDEDEPDNPYKYEGHIDAVFYNPKTNEYRILELKTTSSSSIHEAMYYNSNQALGYAIVLDKIVEHVNAQSSFSVLYLVAKSGQKTFETWEFGKSVVKRSHWINSLIMDIHYLEVLNNAAVKAELPYPMNGGSCYDFFRPCSYFKTCDLDNKRFYNLIATDSEGETSAFAEQEPVMFSFTLDEIIERQEALLADKTLNQAEMLRVETANNGLDLDILDDTNW